MSRKALLFPGQASQYVGMGKDLYDSSDQVRKLYELASEEIGDDIARISFEGPADQLTQTRFTQPAILLHSLAILTVMGENRPPFDFACGHSLGEYGALAAAGALSFTDAVRAVVKRAALMEEACRSNAGTMAALVGLERAQVEQVCKEASQQGLVVPANFNSKTQIVVSGTTAGVEAAVGIARKSGARRAVTLQVGGAFHSPLMGTVGAQLGEFLQSVQIRAARVPVVANASASPVTTPDEIRASLVMQVTAPVRWSETMEYLVGQGVTSIMEVGPGKVLTGLARRDMRPDQSLNLDKLADVEELVAVLA